MAYEIEKNDLHEDMCRAFRKGLTIKQIIKMYGGTRAYVSNVVRNTKRKGDINKNNIVIVRDRKPDIRNLGPNARPARPYVKSDK
jgi:transposase